MREPSKEQIEDAKSFLVRSGIRDIVLRHEGQPNEQTLSLVMATFAVNCDTYQVKFNASVA